MSIPNDLTPDDSKATNHDLAHDWWANVQRNAAGEIIAITLRSPARGRRFDLSAESVVALRAAIALEAAAQAKPADYGDDDSYPPPCTNPGGHEFECTGTAYGGDDERWHGEGRSLCIHCGADGDA